MTVQLGPKDTLTPALSHDGRGGESRSLGRWLTLRRKVTGSQD